MMMKAACIRSFGPPSILKVEKFPIPVPAEGQVLIKTTGSSINPVDAKTRRGLGWGAEHFKDKMPWIPGYDISGIIEKLGPGVHAFNLHDRVVGFANFPSLGGAYAEYALANTTDIIKVPDSIQDLAEVCAIPVAALTAFQGLFVAGNAQRGDSVLIHAAAGGVGHFAVQFAKWKGCKVFCTASEKNREFLMNLGADVVIDYKSQEFDKVIEEPVDFILDSMGFDIGVQSLNTLKKTGRMVTVPSISRDTVIAAGKEKGLDNVVGMMVQMKCDQLQEIVDLVASKKVVVSIFKTFDLADCCEAHEMIESGHVRGKIIFKMN